MAEPEYVNEFFLLDATGALKPFERATPRAEAKPRALGLGGATVSYLISGGRSPVRIAERAGLFAIVRLPSREIDPATVVQLYRLKVKNDRRELQILKANAYLGTKATQEDSAVPFEVSSYGEKSFRIKPKIDLRPGEYAFSLTTSRDGYCFGIDSALAPNR